VFVGAISGAFPAFRGSRIDLVAPMQAGGGRNVGTPGGRLRMRGADGQAVTATALRAIVTPGYAEALGMRLKEGRLFRATIRRPRSARFS
jgi:hypothetical protein